MLLSLRDFQDERADVIHKYTADEARNLKTYGELKSDFQINEAAQGGDEGSDDEEGGVEFEEADIDDICEWRVDIGCGVGVKHGGKTDGTVLISECGFGRASGPLPRPYFGVSLSLIAWLVFLAYIMQPAYCRGDLLGWSRGSVKIRTIHAISGLSASRPTKIRG